MLRLVFVLSIVIAGSLLALRGPFFGLLFYVWNAYFRPEVWVWDTGGDLIASLKLSYIAGAYVVGASLLWRVRHRLTLRAALLVAFGLHTLACAIVAEDRGHSLAAWQEFSKSLLITYFMTVLVTDVARLRTLLLVMALSLGLEGAREGLTQLLINPGVVNNNPIPFLGDNNGVAVGMLMLVPVLSALASTARSEWVKRGLQLLVIGVAYRALSTYSRGAFLAAGALGCLYWLRSAHKVRVLAAIAIVASVVLPVMPEEFWERMGTINTFRESGDESALSRLHFWEVGLVMADQNPLFGVGFQGYNGSYDTYDFSQGEYGASRSVHSVWFGVLAETGYVGLGLYLCLLVSAFLACRAARRAHRHDPALADLRAYALAVETGLVVFVVGGTFLPFQYNEMYLNFIGLSMVLWSICNPAAVAAPVREHAVELAAPQEVPA